MADIVRGSEVAYNIKTASGVAAASGSTGWQALHAYSDSFQPGEGLVDDDELGGTRHNNVDPTLQARGLPNPTGGMQVPFDLSQLPFWLAAEWGAPVTTGASPNYTHTFSSGGGTPVLRHIETPFGADFWKIADAFTVSQMAIDLADIDGYRKIDLTMLGRSVRRLTSALAVSPAAAPVRAKVTGAIGVLKIDDVLLGNVLGGRATMSNGAFMERYFDDSEWPGAVEIGRPSFELVPEIRIRKDANAILTKFDGVTPFKAELLYEINANLSLSVVCMQATAPAVLPNSGGVGTMSVSPQIRGAQKTTTTTAPMLSIVVKNQVAAYV